MPNYDNYQNRRSHGENSQAEPKFGSPYNFVPLNEDVLIPWWNGFVSQDSPLPDAESGIITLTIKNLTPMFIGDSEKIRDKDGNRKRSEYSAHIVDSKGNKRYFIPGSSIRGMLRAVSEILSFSKMTMYDDDYFGKRDFPKRGNANSGYAEEMKDALCGWLRMDHEKLYLSPCGQPHIIDLKQYPKYRNILNKGLNAKKKHDIIFDTVGQRYPEIMGKNLVCTGDFKGKKHEYLFGKAIGPEIEVSDVVKKRFLSIYKPSPYYEFIYNSLRKGESIPVFYIEDAGSVRAIGVTRYFRLPYKYSISECIDQMGVNDCGLPDEDSKGNQIDVRGHDMTQTLFGYVDDSGEALKGRVWISSAFANKIIPDSALEHKFGVLGTPHASFYARYLKQDDNVETPYVTYSGSKGNVPTIAGRKRYRIHSNSYITKLPEGNGNQKLTTNFRLIPKGVEFKLSISFHNLMPEEIGLLLSTITLHGNNGAFHNVGLAKGYGYGKLDIKIDDIKGLAHDPNYYLRFFEYYISNFTNFSLTESAWRDTDMIKTFIAIMSDHREDLEVMQLKDFKTVNNKENKDKLKLKEKDVKVNSYFDKQPRPIDKSGIELHNIIKGLLLNRNGE